MNRNSNTIIWIGVLVLAAIVLREIVYALLLTYPNLRINPMSTFSVSTAAIAVITFFGFVWLADKKGGKFALNKEGMRLAIVAAVVVLDLVLVSTVTFFTAGAGRELPELTQNFLNQFNTTVGVVIAFYFGVSAYVQVRDKDKNDEDNKEKEETK